MQDPIKSNDAFELEWWIRQAQKRYAKQIPAIEHFEWNAHQKARAQGAYSTLAALQVTQSGQDTVCVRMLAIGDSCVLLAHAATQQVSAFPLQQSSDFDRAPYCIPALLKNLNEMIEQTNETYWFYSPGEEPTSRQFARHTL